MLTISAKQENWLASVLEAFKKDGCAIITDVLNDDYLALTRKELYAAQKQVHEDLGLDRLTQAGELGVLRAMMKYRSHFFSLLEVPELLALVDSTVSNTAVMHLQNGFILPSYPADETPDVFQNIFHRDVNRVLNGYVASINVFFAIDEFTQNNGATLVVPGSHQQTDIPSIESLKKAAIPAVCPAGSIILFDSTLWHCAGVNTSGKDRLAINHQFTRSYFKQQIDFVRVLGDDVMQSLPERTQQLLGWYTRVPSTLNDFYQPADRRLYRGGQG